MQGPVSFSLITGQDGGVSRLSVTGEVDLASVRRLKEELRRVTDPDIARVVLDLSGVSFVDSIAIGTILDADSRLRANGQRLEIVPPQGPAGRVLGMLGMDERLHFVEPLPELASA